MNDMRLQVILSAVDKLTAPFRSGITASRKLAEATKAAKDNLKNLESQAASIEQFKSLARTAAITGNELASAKSKTKELAQQIQQTTAPSKALLREFEQAKNKVRELKDREQSLTAQQQRLRQSMQSSGIDVRNLSSEQRRLRQATTDASRALEQQKQKLAALAEQQRRMSAARAAYDRTRATQGAMASTGAGLMATGAAVGALTLKPVVEYAQAEDAATGLKVSMMGAGGAVHKEFGAISDLATKLGNQLPGTTADFQNMMSTLIQQGMSAKSILGGLGQATAYLGVQMKMPYDQAAKFAAKLQDATGTAEKDMMGLMDTIQRSYYLGVDSGNMLGAFTNLSPALSILRKKGLEASQVLAPLIVMADQAGMSGDAAGNAYRKIFQMSMNAGKVSDANKGALKGTGIALQFSDGKGEFAGLDNLFAQLAKMRKLTTEQRLETLKGIYGDDAETLQALNLMIDKGQDGYNATIKKMKDQADLQSRVNTQLGTLKNLWDAATGTFTNALVAFGEAVAPEVKALVTWIGELSERLGAWSKAHPVLSNRLMKTVAAIAAVTAGAGALALAIAAILGPFAMMRFSAVTLGLKLPMLGSGLKLLMMPLNMLTSGVIRLGIAIMTTPVGWMAAAIVALVAVIAVAAALIYKHWAPIKAFFGGVFDGLSAALGPVKALFEPLGPLFDGICRAVKWAFSLFGDLLEPVKYTSTELQNAAAMGKQFGEYMAAGINFALAPLNTMIDGIQWVLDNIGKLPGMGEGAANHAQAIGNNPALASGYVTGNYGQSPPLSNYQPVRAAGSTPVVSNTTHATITVNPPPGMDAKEIGKAVQQALQKEQSKQAVRSGARLGDTN